MAEQHQGTDHSERGEKIDAGERAAAFTAGAAAGLKQMASRIGAGLGRAGEAAGRAAQAAGRAGLEAGQSARTRLGPQATQAKNVLAAAAGRAWAGIRAYVDLRVQPWLAKKGRQLAARLEPGVLKQDYNRLLLLGHTAVFDRSFESLAFVSTSEHIPLSELRIQSLIRLSGHDYKPVPRLVFQWAMEALPADLSRVTFVDFGAGRGRAVLLASHYNFEKVIGVEFAQQLQDDCQMNIAQYPRSLMKCRDVECLFEDAANFQIPDQEAVFYFFNPFNQRVLSEVLNRIAHSYDRNPRRMYLVFVDLADSETIEQWRMFKRLRLDKLLRLKIRLFSPYSLTVFRSLA